MTLFRMVWAFDALAAVIVLFFFFVGLADGTVSTRNGILWSLTVLTIIIVMGGSVWCKRHGYTIPAYLLLSVIAVPGLICVGYILIVISYGKSAWR